MLFGGYKCKHSTCDIVSLTKGRGEVWYSCINVVILLRSAWRMLNSSPVKILMEWHNQPTDYQKKGKRMDLNYTKGQKSIKLNGLQEPIHIWIDKDKLTKEAITTFFCRFQTGKWSLHAAPLLVTRGGYGVHWTIESGFLILKYTKTGNFDLTITLYAEFRM